MALTKVGPAGIGSTPGTGYTIGDSFLHSTGLNATNAYYTGIVTSQNIRVLGDLQVDGTTTTLDTEVTSVDKLEVAANNTTVGVAITQSGSGDILNLYDGSTEVFSVADGGNVFIGNNADRTSFLNASSNNLQIDGGVIFEPGSGNDVEIYNYRTTAIKIGTSGVEKVRIASDGKVGIGTATPAQKLHVFGNTGTNIQIEQTSGNIYLGSSGNTRFGLSSGANLIQSTSVDFAIGSFGDNSLIFGTNNSERLRITSTGNIGIKNTSPNNTLTVGDGVQASYAPPGGGNYIEIARTNGADAGLLINKNTGQWLVGIDNSDGANAPLRFEYGAAGSAHPGFGSVTPAMMMKHNGKIGIGTDNPLNGLDILQSDGRTRITAFGHIITQNHNNSTTNYWSIAPRNGGELDIGYGAADGNGTVDADKVTITTDGKVGIGSVIPTDILDIQTGSGDEVTKFKVKIAGNLELTRNHASAPYIKTLMGSGNPNIILGDSAGDKVKINGDGDSWFNGGNVGINETSPDSKFHVNSGAETVPARFESTGAQSRIGFKASGTPSSYHVSCGAEANDFIVYTNNTEKLRITSAGKILINSTNISNNATMVVKGLSDNNHPIIKVGSSTANGYTFLGDDYSAGDESQFTMGLAYSGASIVTGWGVKVSTSANDTYLSSQDSYSTKHSAIKHDIDGWRFLSNSTSQTVTTGSAVTLTERFRISSDGKVGINQSYPSTKLEVGGGSILVDAYNTSGNHGIFFRRGFNPNSNSYNCSILAYDHNNGSSKDGLSINGYDGISFCTGSNTRAEKLRITSAGKVGVGLVQPQKILDVLSAANDFVSVGSRTLNSGQWAGIHFGYRENNTAYRKSAIVFERVDGAARGKIHILNNNGNDGSSATLSDAKLTILSDGRVSVGGITPVRNFDVYSSSSSTLRIHATGTTTYAQLEWLHDSEPSTYIWKQGSTQGSYAGVNSWNFYNPHNSPIAFYTSNTSRMQIDGAGDVIIASTASPTSRAKLDVRMRSDHPGFNITHNDGSFYRHLGTVGPGSSDGSTGQYLHVRLRTVWNDASMTMFRITGYFPYSEYGESYFGCYRYGSVNYRNSPYGQVISNQGNKAIINSVYNTNADPGYLVIVCDWNTTYNGLMIEHYGAGGSYGSYMQHDLEIIDTKRSTNTSAQW